MKKTGLILLCLLPLFSFAQVKNFGTPFIKNYSKSEYSGGTQNWGICHDKNGFIFFANNDGLLSFDGVRWNLNKISDNSPVRSVFVDSNNQLYIGLINDFGIFERSEPGHPGFKSLKHLLPHDLGDFDDVWRIHEIPDGIVFQCYKYLFIYRSGKIEIVKPQRSFHFSFQLDKRLFIQEPDIGVYEFIEGELKILPYWEEHKDKVINAILETENDQILICTAGEGIYKFENEKIEKWETPVNDLVEKNSLYCAVPIPGDYFAFGTILNGLLITDSNGNIIQRLNSINGLQKNTILSLYVDANKNLWLGLDNGIDYVEINSPISFLGNSKELGTGYCCRLFEGNLYLGTNQGLYVRPFDNSFNNDPFELVENTAGQVWSLEVFDGQLICGHNLGTFAIEDKKATKICDIEGAWKYIQFKNNPDFLLGGHYDGLVVLKKGIEGWSFYKKLKGFAESSRYLQEDKNGEIWISHGEKGIFRVKLKGVDEISNSEFYSAENGLPTTTGNILFEFKSKLFISTNDNIYEYDATSKAFKRSEEISALFDVKGQIKELKTDLDENVWFIADHEMGVLRKNDDLSYTKITSPFKKLSNDNVNEFEFIYPFNNENIFIGVENGFAHYTSKYQKSYSQSFQAFITKMEIPYIDSVLYIDELETETTPELPYKKNTFRIHFSAPFFENESPLLFSYYLEEFSEDWSQWSTDTYKDFSNLPEGDYLLKVKAKNVYEVESEISTVRFVISPPWHRSDWAYFLYLVGFIIFIYLFARFIHYRIKLAKRGEKLRHQLELQKKEAEFNQQALIAEKEIIKLRNDKLRAEKIHRDKELANQTMTVIQKNKLLLNLNDELKRIHDLTSDSSLITRLVVMKKRIARELEHNTQNKLFETYFEDVHADFFERLKKRYPQLSPNDLKLCAYIRMNISSKETAALLNITYKGVEIRRYRLRKKINIPRETNLSTFLSNI